MVTLSHVKKTYGNISPLRDVNAVINKGDVISIIGPSGTGKSTLLHCIIMLKRPTSGKIFIGDEEITAKHADVDKLRCKIGMVFQDFNLFEHMTIIENVMMAPVDLLGKSKQQAYDDGMQLLRTVGLADKAFSYPKELSGGQQQRAAIARTIAMDPEIILFDEPTSSLDPTMIDEVQTVIRDLAAKGMTMMIVSHDMQFCRQISNRIFYMDEGCIYEEGTPDEIFLNPKREKTRKFIQRLKVFETMITSKDFDFLSTNSSLVAFGLHQRIDQKAIYRLQTAFEELIMQIILPTLPKKFNMKFSVEYSSEDKSLQIVILYDGEHFDPNDTDNDLSLLMVKRLAGEIHYLPPDDSEEEARYTNKITLKLQ